MDLHLDGARALVCGASRGIGAAIATELAAEGCRVAIVGRDGGRLSALAARLVAYPIPRDLSEPDAPAFVVSQAVDAMGGLDVLVINSGGPKRGSLANLDDHDWTEAFNDVALMAIRLLKAALPHLTSERAAALIVLSSSVREPIPGLLTSNVLRPGLVGLLKSVTPEIAPVRLNGIAPGRVATDRVAENDAARAEAAGVSVAEIQRQTTARIPLGRYGDAREVGRLAAFLLSPAASYVNGAVVPVDGGMVKALP